MGLLSRYSKKTGRGFAWKGGRSVMSNGYVRLWRPNHPLANKDGHVLEHRFVLYEAGIPIPGGHHVHHKNGDKADNRLENLEVHPAGVHHSNHIQIAGEVTNQFGTWKLWPKRMSRNEQERIKYHRDSRRKEYLRHYYHEHYCKCHKHPTPSQLGPSAMRA